MDSREGELKMPIERIRERNGTKRQETSAAEAGHGSAAVGEDDVVYDDGEGHHLQGGCIVVLLRLHRHSHSQRNLKHRFLRSVQHWLVHRDPPPPQPFIQYSSNIRYFFILLKTIYCNNTFSHKIPI